MEINLVSQQEMTPESLATALASASPEDFSAFWFQFDEKVSDEKLTEFAKAMAPSFGGKRKEPFKKLYTRMEFFEFEEKKRA